MKKFTILALIMASIFAVSGFSGNAYAKNRVTENNSKKIVRVFKPTLKSLTEDQLYLFEITSSVGVENVLYGEMTIAQMDKMQNSMMKAYISEGELPKNAVKLFKEWKEKNNFYAQFENNNNDEVPGIGGFKPSFGLSDDQIFLFEITADAGVESVLNGEMTLEALESMQNDMINQYVLDGALPRNAQELFKKWKIENKFYEKFGV